MASSSSSSSGSSSSGTFHSYPQKYPHTRRKATELVSAFHALNKKGPRTLIATVADTSFHVTQGYVTCTTQLGIVSVVGIPLGSVVNGMRVYVRQMGGQATNRSYVFDGYAANLSGMGAMSGSVSYTSTLTSQKALIQSATAGINTVSGISTATGYFWHLFFYVPLLPITPITLFEMSTATNQIYLEYLPNGQIRFRSQDGHGYATSSSTPIPPHSIHYVQLQPGNGTNEIYVDSFTSGYAGLLSNGDKPTFSANGTGYQLSLLSSSDGSQLCPLGTWISKFGYGTSYTGGAAVPLVNVIPASDAQLPAYSTGIGPPASYTLLLCSTSIGATTLTNTIRNGTSSSSLSVSTPNATVLSTGPYPL